MAPQFEHSALTPPGAELSADPPDPRSTEALTVVAVALGPDERVETDCVRRVNVGRLEVAGVFERVP